MSIFSINDNSNYGSILSQAKANKESKENSKTSSPNDYQVNLKTLFIL